MQVETLPSGTVLHGRYRVERALGSGGFGHVYLSVDLQTNTQYAIKEYLVSGPSGRNQLEHEAQVLSQLHHPNLPAFLAAFDERDRYYVILGYIEGNDLTDYVRLVRQKNEVIPLSRLMEWLLAICDAVAFLHSQRPPIIHRDIKPDNIRITPNGTAILVDLGNAKTAVNGERTLLFIRYQGTPGYAPLEQYPGGSGTDERSDVYALGGTLYFALTAQEPPSVSARNQSLQQRKPDLPSLQERLAENPPNVPQEQRQFRLGVSKPSKPVPRHSRHVAQLGMIPPELLRKLDAIIKRAMAMKPQDRYQSVVEFSNDLRAVLKALPPLNPPPPVVKGRPVDPHSTQPDLPMLYEAMQQQAQMAQAQQAQAANPAPSPSAPRPPTQAAQAAQPSVVRCPRCATPLPRPVPFCPNCGYSFQTPPSGPGGPSQPKGPGPQPSGQGPTQGGPAYDISDEATITIPPRGPQAEIKQGNPMPAASPATPTAQRFGPAGEPLPNSNGPRATTVSSPVPSVPPYNGSGKAAGPGPAVKPFIQSVTSADPLTKTPAQAQMFTATPPASHLVAPTVQAQGQRQKMLAWMAIVLATLFIVMLLLLVFLHHR